MPARRELGTAETAPACSSRPRTCARKPSANATPRTEPARRYVDVVRREQTGDAPVERRERDSAPVELVGQVLELPLDRAFGRQRRSASRRPATPESDSRPRRLLERRPARPGRTRSPRGDAGTSTSGGPSRGSRDGRSPGGTSRSSMRACPRSTSGSTRRSRCSAESAGCPGRSRRRATAPRAEGRSSPSSGSSGSSRYSR
jgi:hypothetical protein